MVVVIVVVTVSVVVIVVVSVAVSVREGTEVGRHDLVIIRNCARNEALE